MSGIPLPPTPPRFLGAGPWATARWALFGAPLDVTGSYRPGSRFGPGAVRSASPVLEEWSPVLGAALDTCPFCDLGDLDLPPGEVAAALGSIGDTVHHIVAAGKRPLMLGGEHLVTWPAVQAVVASHPDLAVLQIDAHCDLRAEYMGHAASHATVMRRVAEVVGPQRCYQLGLRSGTAAEWAYGQAHTRFLPHARALPPAWREELAARPLYLTVDIDFVDPAFAPGTGTPEPGGATAEELLALVDGLVGLPVVAADLVEVAPAYDPAGITAILAAKVVRELLLLP
jgi:agmatinase